MTNNMYRVGDYVYIETSSSSPYQIRRIEELVKTPQGNVEAKVMCFYRRRDIPSHLLAVADLKHHGFTDEDIDLEDPTLPLKNSLPHLHNSPHNRLLNNSSSTNKSDSLSNSNKVSCSSPPPPLCESATTTTTTPLPKSKEKSSLSDDELHQLRHRELFLSRQTETQPATHIRGKCTVTLMNEAESLSSYISKPDTFYYSLVYDPLAKTLLADRGEIRIGSSYQAEIQPLLKKGETDGRVMSKLEDLVWTPDHGLTDRQIDQFLVVARSVGTFARALDCSSSVKQPSLHMSAAAASRDVTLLEAMSLLHNQQYDLSSSLSCLVPSTGPLLCRDQMEEWAASEANLFEEALEKYGKDFNDLRQDFLPWKTLKNIIEYYYMWKTTDRYVQQKRVKAVEAESKLKQVFIPNYNKPNPCAIPNGGSKPLSNGSVAATAPGCESCGQMNSEQWYTWGAPPKQSKLCEDCWGYWKKSGGLKRASRSQREEEEAGIRPVVKTRNSFFLHTSPSLRVMRRLARKSLSRRHVARNPTVLIAAALVKNESMERLKGRTYEELVPWLRHFSSKGGGAGSGSLKEVSAKLGKGDNSFCPQWLVIEAQVLASRKKAQLSRLNKAAPPNLSADGNFSSKSPGDSANGHSTPIAPHHQLLKRKHHHETNGTEGPPTKRAKDISSADPPLDTYKLSQLGVNPPPGLTVTPIGLNGGSSSSPVPQPPVSASNNSTSQAPPPPYHSTHHNTSSTEGSRPVMSHLQHAGGGRSKMATMSRISGRPRTISWMDAPDDVYFYSTQSIRSQRRTLTVAELKRAARKPWRKLLQLPHSIQLQQQTQMVMSGGRVTVPGSNLPTD